MAIPTYDKLLRPLLSLASQQEITRRSAADAVAATFQLTTEETERRIPSGGTTYIRNRTGWAMTFLTKAKLIEKVARSTYRATAFGNEFLQTHPNEITVADLSQLDGWEEAWNKRIDSPDSNSESTESVTATGATATPFEIIDRQVESLRSDLRDRLLQTILDQSSEFFEQLVLDVLVAMGYGGSREDASQRLGRSGDEGIDGRINQDALGLDQILVQAKRYNPDNVISRPQIQAFIGSMTGQGVTKGVFITTSKFAGTVEEFVSRGSTSKIVLVDGDLLIDLMLRHGIGVRVEHRYEIHEIDQNYFEDAP